MTSIVLRFGLYLTFVVSDCCLGLKTSNMEGCLDGQGTFFYILVNDPELQGLGGIA